MLSVSAGWTLIFLDMHTVWSILSTVCPVEWSTSSRKFGIQCKVCIAPYCIMASFHSNAKWVFCNFANLRYLIFIGWSCLSHLYRDKTRLDRSMRITKCLLVLVQISQSNGQMHILYDDYHNHELCTPLLVTCEMVLMHNSKGIQYASLVFFLHRIFTFYCGLIVHKVQNLRTFSQLHT